MHTLFELGAAVRQARKAEGLTQEQLAARAGMVQETLSRFECGRGSDFSAAKLLRLVTALGYELTLTRRTRKPTLEDVLDERKRGANTGPDAA